MATVNAYVGYYYAGFHTDTFFIPGETAAAAYTRTLEGGGSSVTVTFPDLGLRLVYSGTNLSFSGTTPTGGQVTRIDVYQKGVGDAYPQIGSLVLPVGTSWSFAQVFTAAFETAYANQAHVITGTYFGDTLIGGNQDDVIHVGNQDIYSYPYDDVVYGGGGNDTLLLINNGSGDALPAPVPLAAYMGAGSADEMRLIQGAGALNLRQATLSGFEVLNFTGASRLHLDADDLYSVFGDVPKVQSNGGTLVVWMTAGNPLSVAPLQVSGTLVVEVMGTASADTVLGNAVSRDLLRGGASGDWLRGLGAADTLFGGAGADTLDGGAGVDSLYGGLEDDIYVATAGDVFVELAGEGVDRVRAYGNVTLTANVEHADVMTAAGLAVTGNGQVNWISGNAGADTLAGGGGDDILSAGNGADLLTGGTGRDTMNGGAANDILRGEEGDDWLVGFSGNDTITGGDGDDRFVFLPGSGTDRVRDFSTNGDEADVIDLIDVTSITGWSDLVSNHMTQQGLNVVINAGNGDVLILERVWLPLLEAGDFLF